MTFERAQLLEIHDQVILDLRFAACLLDPTSIAGSTARFFEKWIKVNTSTLKIGHGCGEIVFI